MNALIEALQLELADVTHPKSEFSIQQNTKMDQFKTD